MIGCGEHAVNFHGPAQAEAAHRDPAIQLAACCDIDPGRAKRYAGQFGFAGHYDDFRSMIDAERPDAVALVVPVELTCDMGSDILRRGIPALLEKPPGETVAEVDRLSTAARAGGRDGREVPQLVAFNRRHMPLMSALRRGLERLEVPVQHIRYEMVRVNRRDPDFSTTAIHAIDAVRFIAGCDFLEVRFRYHDCPDLGPGVANIFMDAVMASGATAQLSFCPVSGIVAERAEVHAFDHAFFLDVPMQNGCNARGRLAHHVHGAVVEELSGPQTGPGAGAFELGGFDDEYREFFGALSAGRPPATCLAATRQSVAVAEAMRARQTEYRSSWPSAAG
jgi:myo-inositol 2-dehydrogenase / D-chiro-inositol 1-dehydrogenase